MIKKNTKVIFADGENKTEEEMIGGMPLSKGEIVRVHKGNKVIEYSVSDKTIDCFLDGNDQIVNIVYTLKRKN
jgi:hypothetical protein